MVDPWGSHFVVAAAETLGVLCNNLQFLFAPLIFMYHRYLAGPAGLEAQEDQEVVTGAGD